VQAAHTAQLAEHILDDGVLPEKPATARSFREPHNSLWDMRLSCLEVRNLLVMLSPLSALRSPVAEPRWCTWTLWSMGLPLPGKRIFQRWTLICARCAAMWSYRLGETRGPCLPFAVTRCSLCRIASLQPA